MKLIQEMKGDFFKTQLQTGGHVAIAFGEICAGRTWWPPHPRERLRKYLSHVRRSVIPGHLNPARRMQKIIEVEAEAPVLFGAHNLAKLIDVSRLAIRRESHHLAFIAIVRKPQKLRGGRVNDSQRVWILNLAEHFDRIAFTEAPHCRDKIAEAIER